MRRVRCMLLTAALSLTAAGAAGPLATAADESSKPPETILADVARDLAQVRSLHFAGSGTDQDGTTRLSGDVLASGAARFTLRQGSGTAHMILLSKAAYVDGNAAYWRTSGAPARVVAVLAKRWVRLPTSALGDLRASLREVQPKQIAACIGKGTGTLSSGGTATVGGQPAVVVVAAGDQPGTTPGQLYVTTSGPALPLREVQTGPRVAGGTLDPACDDPADTTTASDVALSRFNAPLRIVAPRHAVVLPSGG